MKTFILLFVFNFFLSLISLAQENYLMVEKPSLSSGAEYSLLLERLKLSGKEDLVKYSAPPYKLDKSTEINLINTIEGINFNEDAGNSGFYHIPPDPNGAAGPNHIVSVVNTSIEWHTKAGNQQHSESLANFFSSLGPLTGTFDPKVVYDQYNGRFVVVTLEQQSASLTSRIFVAVSQSNDPNGGWYFLLINSALNIGGQTWADYPGLSVGTDAIYITANMFSFGGNFFQGSRLWIVNKTPFYTGDSATVNLYDPSFLANLPGDNFTMQPTHMFGTAPAGVKCYLVTSGWVSGSTDFLSVITIGGTLSSPTFTNSWVSLGDIHNTGASFPANAPQLGTSFTIMTNDSRMLNAVWRNNIIWAVNTINPSSGTDSGEATAHWYKIGTNGSVSLADQGHIGGETIAPNCYTFFPSIAVNSNDDVVIGFSASASTIYPGCYYTGRVSSDPAGFTIVPDSVRIGRDYYYRTFGSGDNRWGDYSGSSVDPSDDQTFYVFNEYAITRGNLSGGEDGRWGTVWGIVPVSALPVELSSFTAKVLRNGGVRLDWRTETEIDNEGFEILRSAQNDSSWILLGFVEGHGNSNSPKEYSFTDENVQYGSYAYRLKQIDTDGSYEYSNIVEVDAGSIPGGFVLEQNYPNPFNPATTIKFAVAETQKAELKVFDILGNEIETLFNGIAEGGKVYEIKFEAANLPSGIYFYRLETKNKVANKKMLLIK